MDVIDLRNGPSLPVAVIALAWKLESYGYVLCVDGETLRLSGADGKTPSPITDTDRDEIRRWKLHLLALAAYCATQPPKPAKQAKQRLK